MPNLVRGLSAAIMLAALPAIPFHAANAAPTERVLHSFTGGSDGGSPIETTPVAGPGGVFYGTTFYDGSGPNGGVVYQLAPPAGGAGPWIYSVLYSFACGATDGCRPRGGLLLDKSGTLYGTTAFGGAFNSGTVYSLTPPAGGTGPWTEKLLYSFTGGADGSTPEGALTHDASGALYGTTIWGGVTGTQWGAYGNGVVFKLAPPAGGTGPWTETVLYAFKGTDGSSHDGSAPGSGVRFGKGGVLYGVTVNGGTLPPAAGCVWQYGCGTAFKLTPSKGGTVWTEQVLFEFGQTLAAGAVPLSAPIVSPSGVLYGSTSEGGVVTSGDTLGTLAGGTIYQLSPPGGGTGPWTETVLQTLGDDPDYLLSPQGDLSVDASGALYGAAYDGGPYDVANLSTHGGGVFKVSPPTGGGSTWTLTVLHNFTADTGDFCRTGCYPWGGVAVSPSGVVTGTTVAGGSVHAPPGNVGVGTVFQIKQ